MSQKQASNTLQQKFESSLGKLHAQLIVTEEQRDQALAVVRDLQHKLETKTAEFEKLKERIRSEMPSFGEVLQANEQKCG